MKRIFEEFQSLPLARRSWIIFCIVITFFGTVFVSVLGLYLIDLVLSDTLETVFAWVLVIYSMGLAIAVWPTKRFINRYYPDQSNLTRSITAYLLALRWPGIVVYGIAKAIRPPTAQNHRGS